MSPTKVVTKVVLTCTDKGWCWEIWAGRSIMARKDMRLTDTGAKATVNGDPLECVEMELYEAIENISNAYDISRALEMGPIVADREGGAS